MIMAARSEAQYSRYLIRFTDKSFTPHTIANPSTFLSQAAIERRLRYSIAVDSTDLPVAPRYLDSLRLAGEVRILHVSKWLNQVSIQTSDSAALQKIRSFSFVKTATSIAAREVGGRNGTQAFAKTLTTLAAPAFNPATNFYDYGASYEQVHLHNGEFLHNIGLRGQGMTIGMLDAGFRNFNTSTSLDSLNRNSQVLGTYDFVSQETNVADNDMHGLYCLHVVAGNVPGRFVGTAPKAGFYLFRTEEAATEYPIEEHNWVCGAERLDSAGGDVISSSLGYSDGMSDPRFDHTYADMNGKTTIAAIGARLAAKKGLLVTNSAGNQGNETFKYIATPADADSVLAVGATNLQGNAASFSSYGPSADGRVKPDVASVGVNTVVSVSGEVRSGTSFACPNLAGLATCLWQGFREFSNIKIIDALRRSGHKASTPDNRVGYGVPDVKKAVLLLLSEFSTASVLSTSCQNTLTWRSKDITGMRYEVERKAPGETGFTKIGERAASGSAFAVASHQFADSLLNMQAGVITYRIRQVIDTSFSSAASAAYIDTVLVTLAATCTATPVTSVPLPTEEFILLPNPVREKVSLRITTPQAINRLLFRIVDSKGRVLAVRKESKGAGTTTVNFSVGHLAKGSYYLVVYKNNSRVAVQAFIKL